MKMFLPMIARKAAVTLLISLAALAAAFAADEQDDGRLKRENLGGIATLIRTEIAERHIPGAVVMMRSGLVGKSCAETALMPKSITPTENIAITERVFNMRLSRYVDDLPLTKKPARR